MKDRLREIEDAVEVKNRDESDGTTVNARLKHLTRDNLRLVKLLCASKEYEGVRDLLLEASLEDDAPDPNPNPNPNPT